MEELLRVLQEEYIPNELVDYNRESHNLLDIYIKIEGDWKHDHPRANYIAEQFGFFCVEEQVIGEPNSDYYTSIHLFVG